MLDKYRVHKRSVPRAGVTLSRFRLGKECRVQTKVVARTINHKPAFDRYIKLIQTGTYSPVNKFLAALCLNKTETEFNVHYFFIKTDITFKIKKRIITNTRNYLQYRQRLTVVLE